MTPLRCLASRTVVLPNENVDTDQIIPARFLTTTTKDGLGRALFADWRYDKDGRPRADFALNAVDAAGAQVLVAGRNFGCGSSREHAVWALADHGFRAVIAPSFADIFRRNALKNGLVPVTVTADVHARLASAPGASVTVDVESLRLILPDGVSVPFALEPFPRYCLLEGQDELQFLLSREAAIAAFESRPSATPPLQEVS
ncbi:MAG TPA: 3-isopropylmalate dehydratase small subunit [Vicinamibacteria bacterium]|nr:3-isopropylmalate dehydratase small subunit [Vicinamibacteria bacterium]